MDSPLQLSSPTRPPRRVSVASVTSPTPDIKSPKSPKSPKSRSASSRKHSIVNIDSIASQCQDAPPPKIPKLRASKIPATPGRGLHEITEAQENARMMPPPSLPIAKRSALPEKPKRKTLAERAGENNIMPSAPLSRSQSVSLKPISVSGLRTTSVSSSGPSTRVPSATSRVTSGSSISSATGLNRSTSVVRKKPLTSRTAQATQGSMALDESAGPGKRNGRTPIIHQSPEGPILLQRQRQRSDHNAIYPSRSSGNVLSSMNPFRNISITTAMQQLSLNGSSTAPSSTAAAGASDATCPDTPSYIPKLIPQTSPRISRAPSPVKSIHPTPSPKKSSGFRLPFLSRYTNTQVAWDTHGRMDDMEQLYKNLKEEMNSAMKDLSANTDKKLAAVTKERDNMQDKLGIYKIKVNELESAKSTLSSTNKTLQAELEDSKVRLVSTLNELDNMRRTTSMDMDDLTRKHRNAIEDMRDDLRRSEERLRKEAQTETDRLIRVHLDELEELERRKRMELEEERSKRLQEMQEVSTQLALHRQTAELESGTKDRELQMLKTELEQVKSELEKEHALNETLKRNLTDSSANTVNLESSMQAMKAKISFLESNSHAQSEAYADMDRRMQEAIASAEESKAKLRQEETLRRKLHNQVQELKGNIRVFCRVRPPLGPEADEAAKMAFPDEAEDSKELVVTGPEQKSSLGTVTASKNAFSFDRVFGPSSQNPEIFDEISQLVQSALDGYNVCIFCYGQTGSGKTHTMSSKDGMIPLAVHQIYDTATKLEEKGWKYSMEGSFVEVYNENLNDLLGKAEELDKKKLDIRHDNAASKTTIVGVETMMLDSPNTLNAMLQRADGNRSVAATKANMRSSRSHSVFILKLTGVNSMTGERSEGTLNLVDLAGSERLGHSQATGDRLKETQSINKSLSCLGDVIAALGQGKDCGHVPYRNSKLTYLLQHSLGGNSKTLMFVMISPLQAHLSETLTSLKFATKVHNTHIGTAKRQARVSS